MTKRKSRPKKTEKELVVTLVFRGVTDASLDEIVEDLSSHALTMAGIYLCPWARHGRVKRYEARDLTLHPHRLDGKGETS
jgi:hypothetical protein